ncbi:uncharacterized protein DNG_07296 [Cephalotrichum gorgonifer]|uniref:F-box domain-containing protein n=1 Tax=Cephalotrichum gorgonifer TaxID=2041049 RepID=A0AAE8N1B5_9PEZI|nr:uncharacterized protein DNG_07296 [Cephalotrichum gorgonifer]
MGSPPDHSSKREEPVGLDHLPLELLLKIADSDLVLENFTACVQVSRGWHALWTQPTVAAALCRKFFPTQLGPHTFSTFQKGCRKFFRRRHGKHTCLDISWLDYEAGLPCHFEPDPGLHPDGSCPEQWGEFANNMTYGGGNIVWNDGEGDVIFIDNLYTRKRKAIEVSAWDFVVPGPTKPFIYHLGTNIGVKYVFEEPESEECELSQWLSIRTWAKKVFITTSPSSVHVFSHDGANLSLDHIIDRYSSLSMGSPGYGFIHGGAERIRDHDRTNFLPNIQDRDGVFIVMKGLIPGPKVEGPYSHFLVREFSGAEHLATYACDIEETMRREMVRVFGKRHDLAEREMAGARQRATSGPVLGEMEDEQDVWAGVCGGDEGVYEVFRFAFKAHDLDGGDPLDSWVRHFQVSVNFCTIKRQFGAQSVYIDDGQDLDGTPEDEWVPRACMLRDGQFLRVYRGSHLSPSPTIVSRDISWGGRQRTRRLSGKSEGLYPLKQGNKLWNRERMDPTLDLGFFHDENFTVLWDHIGADCIVFDFRESGDEMLKLSEVEEGTNTRAEA